MNSLMNYIDITKPGGPDALTLKQGPRPVAAATELLIKVAAAGVNRPDLLQRQGGYPPPVDASPILGLEVAGTVAALGSDVVGWQVGDAVCALVNGGGYAEYVAVAAAQCLPVPAGLSLLEAAALPETCFTVWSNVFDRAGLKPGETFLVHGGAGGIGTTAIQMAAFYGARVFATAGSDDKCNLCQSLGAERAINYRNEDFVEVVKAVTNGRGVDVILDMVGGDYLQRNIKAAAVDGRIVNIAFLQGATAPVNFMPVMLKRLTLSGSTLRSRSAEVKAEIAAALREHIWPAVAAGKIRPVIDRTYPLAEAAAAHERMESGELAGKLVLTI